MYYDNYDEDFEYGKGYVPSKKDIRDYRLNKVYHAIPLPDSFEVKHSKIKSQGAVGSCHDDKTEVLTSCGWKLFKDVCEQDLLASVSPEDGTLIFERPTKLLCYHYDGDMIQYKTSRMDFLVTPNHKMLVKNFRGKGGWDNKFQFVDADDLGFYSTTMQEFHYKNPQCCTKIILGQEIVSNGNILQETSFSMSDWVQFLGIYLAEGTAYSDAHKYHYKIQIAGVKRREKDYIRELLSRMGLGFCETSDRFQIYNKRVWNFLDSYGLIGVKSYDKFVPDFIMSLDESYIKDFLFGFFMGDGSSRGAYTKSYWTSSKKLAEQISILLWISGSPNTIKLVKKAHEKTSVIRSRKVTNLHDCYTVYTRICNCSIDRKKHLKKVQYSGYVYCAEVPTYHTLITRRNGKVLLSGNCVAYSVSEVLESLEDSNKDYSTAWIYGYRPTGYYQGTGMMTSDALKTVNKVGAVQYEVLPGNYEMPKAKQIVKKNLAVYKQEAGKDRVVAYAKLRTIQEIKEAIYVTGKPVVICILCSDLKLDENYIAYIPDGATGGHAVVCYGWNEIGLLIQNSWGESWGDKGCFILPYEHPFSEAWVLTKDPDIAIKPRAFAFREFFVNLVKLIATFIKGLFKKK